jgi:hypothetical protein
MANHSSRKWSERFVDHSWLLPAITVVVLIAIATGLVFIAHQIYDSGDPDGFPSILASGIPGGAGVAVFGAAITGLLTLSTEIRARAERNMKKRLELFRRMREAHVSIALAQQVLRARGEDDLYHAQMQDLMQVAKDLEEIREEVRVSNTLYAEGHRRSIMEGIALIVIFLQEGIAEYTSWCWAENPPRPLDHGAGNWLEQLVEERESPRSWLQPSDEAWEPSGNMPTDYDKGLEKSKRVMREYVYGSKARRASRTHFSSAGSAPRKSGNAPNNLRAP